MVHIMAVCELPYRDFCKILVSLESLKLIYLVYFWPSFSITLLKASRLLLMLLPSLFLELVVQSTPSDPAKSTRFTSDVLISFLPVCTVFSLICI